MFKLRQLLVCLLLSAILLCFGQDIFAQSTSFTSTLKEYRSSGWILSAGGAGFIGFHLAKKLIEEDYKIDIIDNFSRGIKDSSLDMLIASKKISVVNYFKLVQSIFYILIVLFSIYFKLTIAYLFLLIAVSETAINFLKLILNSY